MRAAFNPAAATLDFTNELIFEVTQEYDGGGHVSWYAWGSQEVCDNGVGIPLTGGVSMSKSKKITVDQLVAAMPAAIDRAVKDQASRPQGAADLTPVTGFLPPND